MQILLKVLCNLAEQMHSGIAAADAVVAIGIGQLAEILVGLNQRLSIFGNITVVHVIVSRTLADKQMAMQLAGPAYGAYIIALGILLGSPHIALGIYRVIITPVSRRCYGYAGSKYRTALAHAHQGIETSKAPAPDTDTVLVNIG